MNGTVRVFDPDAVGGAARPLRAHRARRRRGVRLHGRDRVRALQPADRQRSRRWPRSRAPRRSRWWARRTCVDDVRTMGGEDFSAFLRKVPGCFIAIGSRNAARGLTYDHHHPRFDVDEACLEIGAEVLLRTARRFLGRVSGARLRARRSRALARCGRWRSARRPRPPTGSSPIHPTARPSSLLRLAVRDTAGHGDDPARLDSLGVALLRLGRLRRGATRIFAARWRSQPGDAERARGARQDGAVRRPARPRPRACSPARRRRPRARRGRRSLRRARCGAATARAPPSWPPTSATAGPRAAARAAGRATRSTGSPPGPTWRGCRGERATRCRWCG